jgi:predicted CXXCH cytochrome family protein
MQDEAARRAPCAQRSRLAAGATRVVASFPRMLSDTHTVSSLGRGLYHADGQMLDEVYNYGSFKQSKMFAAGVTCSDCHEPHGAKLRSPGDGVCLQCHASDKYAAVAHHQHAEANPPLSCASCHMPTRT